MEILKPHGAPFRGVELGCVEFLGEFGYQQQALAALPAGYLLGAFLLFHYFDMILGGKVAQGFHIAAVLVFHHETHGGAGLSAAEALEYALGRRHVEGRRLFVVERTAGHIVGPAAPERHEIPHHVFDPCRVEDKIDCILGYHEAISHRNFMRTRRISISS